MRRRIGYAVLAMAVSAMMFSGIVRAEEDTLCGVYDIQGWEPDGDTCSTPDYIGAIELSKKGDVYLYQGSADNIPYEGIGYAEQGGRVLHFAYRGSDGDTGIIRCENMNGIWVCRWVSMGTADGKPGRELWEKHVLPVEAPPTDTQE